MVCYLSAVPDCDTVIHIYVAYTGDSLDAFKLSDLTNLSVVKLGTVYFLFFCIVYSLLELETDVPHVWVKFKQVLLVLHCFFLEQ